MISTAQLNGTAPVPTAATVHPLPTARVTWTAPQVKAPKAAPRKRRTGRGKIVAAWITSRARDLAMATIVVAAFIAVFQGSHYSATRFGFASLSAVVFALMPDALMVLSAAKMRQTGVNPEQRKAAKRSMQFGLTFSLLTNMIAAFLQAAPAHWVTDEVIFAGTVLYHGVVVLILWYATETLTKVRADAPSVNGKSSGNAAPAAGKRSSKKASAGA